MKIIFNGLLFDERDPQVQIDPFNPKVKSVFETFKVQQGRLPRAIKQHWERLFASAQIMEIVLPRSFDQEMLENTLAELLNTLDLGQDYRLKIWLSDNVWWIKATDLEPFDADVYKQGIIVDEAVVERAFPTAKWTSPLYQQYWEQQKKSGAFETLFFSEAGLLLEGNVSNVVAVLDGAVVSPQNNVLPGITVRELFRQVSRRNLKTEFRDITREELKTASEIFITNAIKGIVPIKQWKGWLNTDFAIYNKYIIDIN